MIMLYINHKKRNIGKIISIFLLLSLTLNPLILLSMNFITPKIENTQNNSGESSNYDLNNSILTNNNNNSLESNDTNLRNNEM